MNHNLHRCDEERCSICEGGLALCTVCGGGEASLPSECPGRRMTGTEEDAVQAGRLDYCGGAWVEGSPITGHPWRPFK